MTPRIFIEFFTVYVNDPQTALDFYVNKLGMEVRRDEPGPMGTRFVAVAPPGAETGLTLVAPQPEMMGAEDASRGRAQIGGFAGVVFATNDIQATYDEWQRHGVRFTQPPARQPWGLTQAQFVDQDGNRMVLVEIHGH